MPTKKNTLIISMALLLTIATAPFVQSAPSDDTRLPDAAMQNDRNGVKNLLTHKVDVNQAQGDGSTALHWAAYHADAEMVRMLLKAGADVKAKTRIANMTPLFLAAQVGSAEVVKLLLENGSDANAKSDIGTTPLMLAASSGQTDTIQALLDHNVDVNAADVANGQTAVMFAAAHNRGDAITLLAKHGADLKMTTKVTMNTSGVRGNFMFRDQATKIIPVGGNTALHFAVRQGQMDAVRALVAAGADVNQVSGSDDMPAITEAIFNGHFDIAKFLLDNGADPTLASKDQGLTALYATIDAQWAQRTMYPPPNPEQEKTSYLDLMQALLEKGADANARLKARLWFRQFNNGASPDQKGATAFWRATQAHDLTGMKLLLARGADPNIPTEGGCTPLLVASGINHSYQGANLVPDARFTVVKYLVEELHADVNAKDKLGYTPLHGAALIGANDIVQYLVDKGADVKAQASQISGTGDGGGTPYPAEPGKGDSPADMANGWTMNYPQFPETVALLVKLGSPFSNKCWAATCNNPVVEKEKEVKKPK